MHSENDQEQDCDCKEGMFPRSAPTDRRRFLFAAGSAAGMLGSTAAMAQKAPPGAVEYDVPADPTKVPGRAVAADGGYGTRSQFETEVRVRFPTANEFTSWSLTPLDKMLGNLTASGLHFERHHGGIPTIDPASHLLFVHGMVDSAKKFTMADLKRFPGGHAKALYRVFGKRPDRMEQADRENGAGHARPAQHIGVDRRAIRHDCARGRPARTARHGYWPKAPTPRS